MRHLSGFDATFLYAETPRTHMHSLKVLVFALPRARGEALRAAVVAGLEAQLDALPALRMKPAAPPWGLGHPVWETVPVRVDEHVHFRALADAPGAREAAIGEHLSRPLRRNRPLWEALVLQDEAREQLVVAMKIHHAVADGQAAEQMLEIAAGAAAADEADEVDPIEASRRRWLVGLVRGLRAAASSARLIGRTARGLARRAAKQLESRGPGTLPFSSPQPPFAREVTGRRAVGLLSVPFEPVRAIHERFEVKVNDVVLTLVAGALRRYLTRRGVAVERPLVAALPVGVGTARHAYGNHLSNMMVAIPTDEPDPLRRLTRSARSASDAKALHRALGEDLLMGWSELTTPLVLRGVWKTIRWVNRAPAALIVSNVAGPKRSLRVQGLDLEDLYSSGPLLETTGLNFTFWSYAGRLNGCALMCPDHDSDPSELARDFEAAFTELSAAAGQRLEGSAASASFEREDAG